MAAHTYWRLNIAGTDGGATLTLAEIEMRSSVGGANIATGGNNGVLDSSTPAHIMSLIGSAVRTVTQQKYGTGSIDTRASSTSAVTSPDSADWDMGAGQFTMEGYVRFTSSPSTSAFLCQWDNGVNNTWFFGMVSGSIVMYLNGTATLSAAWSPTLNTWYHVAVDRDGTNLRLYVDGVVKGTVANSTTITNSAAILMIGNDGANRNHPGFLDEMRITKGVARYAGAFTPPTAAFPDSVGAGDASFASVVLLTHFEQVTGEVVASSGTTGTSAFDASNATNWAATTNLTSGWIQYYFATAQDIVEHAITAPSATMTNAPNRWTIQYSDDGLAWTTAAIVGGQTGWTSNEQRVFTHSGYPLAIGCASLLPAYLPAITVTPAAFTTRATLRNDAGLQTSPMISGTVKQGGVACARTVRAYCRLTGEVLGEATSDGTTGAFSINARGKTDSCYVIALDDLTASPDYNAQIFDLIIPV